MKKLHVYLLSVLALAGCTKEPGIGGKASIKGSIHVYEYNSFGTFKGDYDAQDKSVYLIYGDEDEIYDDEIQTSYDGSFEFKYLNKGTYKLFTYSNFTEPCTNCTSEDSVVIRNIEITSKNEVIDLGVIDVKK